MNSHEAVRNRIISTLRQRGIPERDARAMIRHTLKAVRENERECVEICQGTLGLEFEYIVPLLQPKEYYDVR